MAPIDVDGLLFSFPDGWKASKYDEWSYYRNQFVKMSDSIRAVDLIARSPDGTVWLIEAKDYRHPDSVFPTLEGLTRVCFEKVFGTLAALLPASLLATDSDERAHAKACCRGASLRVVIHIELPLKRSTLFPRGGVEPANLRLKLKQILKPIDPHLLVVSSQCMGGLQWSVAQSL